MRRLLIAVLMFIVCSCTYAQSGTGQDTTKVRQLQSSYGFDYKNVGALYTFVPPKDTVKLRVADSGAIAFTSGRYWSWTGYRWDTLRASGSGGAVPPPVLYTAGRGLSLYANQFRLGGESDSTIFLNMQGEDYIVDNADTISMGTLRSGSYGTTLIEIAGQTKVLLQSAGVFQIDAGSIDASGTAAGQFGNKLAYGANDVSISTVPIKLTPISSEPSGTNGYMYYNSSLGKFRVYENGSWKDLATGSITASNGLTKTSDDIKLGGSLLNNTDIDLSGYSLNLIGQGRLLMNDGRVVVGSEVDPLYGITVKKVYDNVTQSNFAATVGKYPIYADKDVRFTEDSISMWPVAGDNAGLNILRYRGRSVMNFENNVNRFTGHHAVILFDKYPGFSDTVTVMGRVSPLTGISAPTGFAGILSFGGAGVINAPVLGKGWFSALSAEVQLSGNSLYNNLENAIWVHAGIHGSGGPNAVKNGYAVYINGFNNSVTNKYALYQAGTLDTVQFNGKIKIPNLALVTDTSTYKPLAINNNGNIYRMDSWPGGGSLISAANGTSVSGSSVVLGQDVGDIDNPAMLFSSREIPTTSSSYTVSLKNISNNTYTEIGSGNINLNGDYTAGIPSQLNFFDNTSSFDNAHIFFHPGGTLNLGLNSVDYVTINSIGDVAFGAYPNSRNDGSTTKALYVDAAGKLQYGNISVGGAITGFTDGNGFDGTITGSDLSVTTQLSTGSIPFIGASGALSQDNANLFWDNSNKRLGINNSSSPASTLNINATSLGGTAQTSTTYNSSALILGTNTAAANNAQQFGAPLLLRSNGWGTTAGTSQSVDWRFLNLPTQSGVPGSSLRLQFSANGASFSEPFLFNSSGQFNATASIFAGANNAIGFVGSTTLSTGGVNGNLLLRNNANNNFGMLVLGNPTSSFPALKRNGAGIDIVLGDDSGPASFRAGDTKIDGPLTVGRNVWTDIRTVTSSLTIDDTYHTVLIDASGGPVTVTLPSAASSYDSGKSLVFVFKRIDGSGNTITIAGGGSDTIDGSPTAGLNISPLMSMTIQSAGGTAWYITQN